MLLASLAWVTCVLLGLSAAFVINAPPRGWNRSKFWMLYTVYDCWTWRINETAYLENAALISQYLLPYGYEYQELFDPSGSECGTGNMTIDEYGRLQPDIMRFPSAAGGAGFRSIADKVHSLGLKFGIHVMRGISMPAIEANTPILGTDYHAQDIALMDQPCDWCPNMVSVNISHPAGQAFLDSVYGQYAEWGVDFIKNDCVFGYQYDQDGIEGASTAMYSSGRAMVYSLSPGESSGDTTEAGQIHNYVNMYRVTDDDWDSWDDLASHFAVLAAFQQYIGVSGRYGQSYPDADMLPIGYITEPGTQMPPYHMTDLTQDEQYTQVTLCPLMFGGDMTHLDPFTLSILTNPELLAVNSYSSDNQQLFGNSSGVYAWTATGSLLWEPDTPCLFLAVFNTGEVGPIPVTIRFSQLPLIPAGALKQHGHGYSGLDSITCEVRDLWAHEELGPSTISITVFLNVHGAQMLALYNCGMS